MEMVPPSVGGQQLLLPLMNLNINECDKSLG